MASKYNPGCGCCQTCVVCADNFQADDNADPNVGSPCGWVEFAGNWERAAHRLVAPPFTGLIRCETLPNGPAVIVHATVVSSISEPISLLADFAVTSYFAGTIDGATLALCSAVGGSETELEAEAHGLDVSAGVALRLCLAAGTLAITARSLADGESKIVSTAVTLPGAPGYTALRASNGELFSAWSIADGWSAEQPTCPRCPLVCGGCDAGTVPPQYQLTVPENTWFPVGLFHCPSCAALWGSFLLDWDPAATLHGSGQCAWTSAIFEACNAQLWSGETPVGDPAMREFFWQFEIGIDRALFLLQPDPPFGPLLHYQWRPADGHIFTNDCRYSAFPFVFHTTHGGITGCGIDTSKILLLDAAA